MTHEYALSPFQPGNVDISKEGSNQTWISKTTLYSLDMSCEVPKVEIQEEKQAFDGFNFNPKVVRTAKYTSGNGCGFPTEYYGQVGNQTIGPNPDFQNQTVFDTKEFSSVYVGYYRTEWSDYYLQGLCPKTANHTFMAMFTRNKRSVNDPPQNVTRLFCTPFYYQQEVNATISAQTKSPIHITAIGEKEQLPTEKWNSTFFEYQMNTGRNNGENRGALPFAVWPDQLETLSTLPLSLGDQGAVLQAMAGYVVGAARRPLEELLDPEVLRTAYEATYRIIFARSMLEILDQEFVSPDVVQGELLHTMRAIVVVPVFTYVVEGLLGVVSLCSIVLLVISMRRKWNLRSDPVTIASIQSLVAENTSLLNEFGKLDQANMEDFEKSLKDRKFKLDCTEQGVV